MFTHPLLCYLRCCHAPIEEAELTQVPNRVLRGRAQSLNPTDWELRRRRGHHAERGKDLLSLAGRWSYIFSRRVSDAPKLSSQAQAGRVIRTGDHAG